MIAGVAAYALAWAAFGLAHSLLARDPAKAWLKRRAGRWMRLVWNAIATVQLAAVLWVGRVAMPAPPAWPRPGWLLAAQGVAGLLGLFVLWRATGSYDMRRFAGIAQLRGADVADDEPFRVAGPLRYVRHPLYLGMILLLLAITADARGAATLLLATAYVLIGLRYEEAALLRRFGAAYGAYRARVPALLPWRGRAWGG